MALGRKKKSLGPLFTCRLSASGHQKCLVISQRTGASFAEVVRRRVDLAFKRELDEETENSAEPSVGHSDNQVDSIDGEILLRRGARVK